MPDRPSKKQHELLEYIKKFVEDHGYGPSYREIMNGCSYSSVATVALHVNNLTKKGLLRKNGRSARSLEVVGSTGLEKTASSPSTETKEKWLEKMVEVKLAEAEKDPARDKLDKLETLIGALKILGFASNAEKFQTRLEKTRQNHQ